MRTVLLLAAIALVVPATAQSKAVTITCDAGQYQLLHGENPRIANLRPDKPVDEIDTLETVRALYEGLQQGAEQLVTAGART